MTDQEKLQLVQQVAKVATDAVTANEASAVNDALVLIAQFVVDFAPPIDAPALDPVDRANVDADVNAGVSKT
jgi:hypothetical protein